MRFRLATGRRVSASLGAGPAMSHIEAVIVSLLVAVAVLSALATRIRVPYPILRRYAVPRRMVNVLEGESLINDASALVIYRIALGAVGGAAFSLLHASLQFVGAAAGGVAIGLVVAIALREIRRRLDDPPVEVTISLLSGYAAYVPADAIGASGVVAAVTCGVAMGWWAPEI